MKNFYIITNPLKDKDSQIAENVHRTILSKQANAKVEIAGVDFDATKVPKETELIIVIGGDGSVLSVAKKIIDKKIPVIGVNLGTVGYLTEIEQNGIAEAIDSILLNSYKIEERMMLEGTVYIHGEEDKANCALNDIVITRRGDLQVIGYRITVNGSYLNDFYADGIILSTPTGSTGYNLSAGGSIVEPSAKLIVLTPICPHTLNTRSIILSVEDTIDVEILPPKGEKPLEVGVYFDGGDCKPLNPGDHVKVTKSDYVTEICKLKDESFLEVLHQKISE